MQKVKGLFSKAESQNDNGKSLPPPVELQPPGVRNDASTQASSLYPQGDFRNGNKESILDIKADIMCSWLHTQQSEKLWTAGGIGEGVVLKKGKGDFTCAPFTLQADRDGLFDQIVAMNVKSALTVNTRVIQLFLQYNTAEYVPLPDGLRLQVLPSMADLPRCQKHHFGAFIRDRQMLVVWDDDPLHLLPRALHLEQSLMQMTWGNEGAITSDEDAKVGPNVYVEEAADEDLERRSAERRPVMLIHAVISGLTLTILTGALGFGFRNLAQEIGIDGKYTRLALLAVLPCQVFVSLFFMQVIIGNLAQCFGPISQMNHNSRFYSGVKPPQLSRENASLPHITIQMPVYKEGLSAVIQPTIFSLKKAISTYEMQGGTANIFVNDDGMQIIDEDKAQARREFYNEHRIGWVARPPHNPPKSKSGGKGIFGRKTSDEPEGNDKVFLRRGKFKKASNMNYALMISNKVEDKLTTFQRPETWTHDDEHSAYLDCLSQVLNEQNGQAWAEGNIRVGDYILLIDSDTRVPVDCLLDAASEMEMSPEVGILQYASGVLQVTDSFFENAVTFFTNLIYTAVRFGVANGDVSPFVGHNAVLRWSAIQDVASYFDEDNYEKFWSESHVSEDFDMALRLQTAGYTIRYGAYTGTGFKEGVSLTVYDELNRWEKYAYGCNEMLFHPFRFWFTKGPFTPLFRRFVGSNMPIGSKITIISYIGTYYAIGAAWILTLANYFLVGWARDYLDKYYLESFKIYFAIVIVFNGLGNVALAVVRYRLSEKSLFGSLFENFKWVILFTIFFSGISLHISQALLCHFFEIDMNWGATAKEVENISFFDEIPRLLKRFKMTFLFCFISAGIMIAGALYVPWEWRIGTFNAIWPLTTVVVGHFLLPVALNPALMMFTW